MTKKDMIIRVLILAIIAAGIIYYKHYRTPDSRTNTSDSNNSDSQTPTPPPVSQPNELIEPIDNAQSRVTKKPFGLYVTPKSSPVQPERFTGYHTGVDFETFPNEANVDVSFYAICAGKILQKRTASGYGGVLVESCTINNQVVTVVYGHVSVKSINKNIGDNLIQGEKIGNLGHSPDETDGERKHLHLGIHKGSSVNITGYVQNQSLLADWLDFEKLIQ